MELGELFPHLVTGIAAGLVAWGGVKIEMRWLRRDVDGLRYTVHSAENPRNLVTTVQAHENRIRYIEGRPLDG